MINSSSKLEELRNAYQEMYHRYSSKKINPSPNIIVNVDEDWILSDQSTEEAKTLYVAIARLGRSAGVFVKIK